MLGDHKRRQPSWLLSSFFHCGWRVAADKANVWLASIRITSSWRVACGWPEGGGTSAWGKKSTKSVPAPETEASLSTRSWTRLKEPGKEANLQVSCRLKCWRRLDAEEKVFPQLPHTKGFESICVLSWSCKSLFERNDFWHLLQTNGSSPVCLLSCTFRSAALAYLASQRRQPKLILTPVWSLACSLRTALVTKPFPQTLQSQGLSPECLNRWVWRWTFKGVL